MADLKTSVALARNYYQAYIKKQSNDAAEAQRKRNQKEQRDIDYHVRHITNSLLYYGMEGENRFFYEMYDTQDNQTMVDRLIKTLHEAGLDAKYMERRHEEQGEYGRETFTAHGLEISF